MVVVWIMVPVGGVCAACKVFLISHDVGDGVCDGSGGGDNVNKGVSVMWC